MYRIIRNSEELFGISKNSENVFGMSSSKKNFEMKIEDTTMQTVMHLAKLYFFFGTEYREHWEKEIWGYLHNVPKIKNRNKLPTRDMILDNTIKINDDMISVWANQVYREYSKNNIPSRNLDVENFKKFVYQYYDWLSESLSIQGNVLKTEVKDKLDELLTTK